MITHLRKEGFSTDELCGAMEVSHSGYYAHRRKPEGTRRQEDSVLRRIVAAAFVQSRETYGTPRLREVVSGLTETPVSRARIARLMEELGIAPRQKRAFIPRTTVADPAANLLLDRPPTTGINQVWVTDITYIPTRGAGSAWRRSWTSTAAASLAGPLPRTCAPDWSPKPSNVPASRVPVSGWKVLSPTATADPNTPPPPGKSP